LPARRRHWAGGSAGRAETALLGRRDAGTGLALMARLPKLALTLATALLLLASLAQAAPVTAYVRTADGKWLKTEATEVNGRITLTLKPEQLGGARPR